MKSKTVVVLPGSFWQIPIIKKCKAIGYRTLVVNPYDDSPAFPFADGYLKSDIFDIENVIRYCIEENADAIISEECDIAMPVIAEIGKRLSLNTLDKESAWLFTNKYAMKNFCEKHSIPYPEYKLCHTAAEAEKFFEQIQSDMIIKPLDSNSSHGVFTVKSCEDIANLFDESRSFSKTENAVLAERYINGTEFTVDGIKTPEKHFTLAISEKKHFEHNKNIARELYFTRENSKYDYSELAKQNDFFVDNSPLQFGLTHAEYKYENGKFYLIEIAARGGGNLISSHIVPFLSGFDNYQYLLECSLGNITCPDFSLQDKLKNKCAVLYFFDSPADGGICREFQGTSILENTPQVVEYRFNVKKGDIIKNAVSDAERIGFYIACCESKEELDSLMQNIHNNVKIVCE